VWLASLPVSVPALFMAGDHDLVISFPGTEQALANLKNLVPGLRVIKMLAGCMLIQPMINSRARL
jgi:epoxide hydrolase A/B